MSRKFEFFVTIVGDAALLTAIYFISWKASAINQSIVSWHSFAGSAIMVVIWLFLFQTFELYEPRYKIEIMNEIFRQFRVLCLGLIIMVTLAYIVKIDFIRARGFLPAYVVMLPSMLVWRFLWRGIVGEYFKPQREKVIIFENGDEIENYGRFHVVEKVKLDSLNPSIPQHLLNYNGVQGIVIESNGTRQDNILKIISGLTRSSYEIFITPKLYPFVYQYFLIQKVPDSHFLKINFYALSTWDRFLKRVMDIGLALLTLFVLSPILLMISLLIKIDSPGSVLYTQRRVGVRGKEFTLFKFRSMIRDAEKYTGPVWADRNDPRITRTGKILRPLRLDELPQLLNVLRGDMSFVGPRPERPAFVENLKQSVPFYSLRLNVLPGITGLAQVKHAYDKTIEDVKRKLEYDLEYINKMSLRLDLKIFLKTVLTVLQKKGAH